MVDLLKDEDVEKEIEENENENPVYTHTNAPYPKDEMIALLKSWLNVVSEAEDFSDDLKDELKNIPNYHFAAFGVKVQTELMKAGVYEDKDGRLVENKKRGVKLK